MHSLALPASALCCRSTYSWVLSLHRILYNFYGEGWYSKLRISWWLLGSGGPWGYRCVFRKLDHSELINYLKHFLSSPHGKKYNSTRFESFPSHIAVVSASQHVFLSDLEAGSHQKDSRKLHKDEPNTGIRGFVSCLNRFKMVQLRSYVGSVAVQELLETDWSL